VKNWRQRLIKEEVNQEKQTLELIAMRQMEMEREELALD